MGHALQLVLRFLAGAAGLTSVYAALFLYEDEQGKIQNKLEEWWIRFDDEERAALSRHTAFMKEVARLGTRGFDLLFKDRLFSRYAFSVSFCFAVASLCLCAVVARFFSEEHYPASRAAIMVTAAAVSLACGIVPALTSNRALRLLRWFPLVALLVGLGPALSQIVGEDSNIGGAAFWVLAPITVLAYAAWSFIFDVTFIAVTRWALKWSAAMDSFAAIAAVVLVNGGLGALLVGSPFLLLKLSPNSAETWGAGLSIAAYSNTIDFVAASVFLILALTLLAHRLLWPAINRPLYALQNRGVRKKFFSLAGVTLLGYAGLGFPVWISKILSAFGW
ncbi:MAG TPA: hypothetical protein VI455_16015 [Terriglobia bacterium]